MTGDRHAHAARSPSLEPHYICLTLHLFRQAAGICRLWCTWLSLLSSAPLPLSSCLFNLSLLLFPPTTHSLICPQELAKERFDPTRYLSVFKQGHPEWLNKLIQHRQGRQLIYDLSMSHRSSLLLNYAIQRILKQVGSVKCESVSCDV